MSMKCGDLLFVYGTLRPGQRAWSYIKDQVEVIGDASIEYAEMYNLGSYPGVILLDKGLFPSNETCYTVHGTLLRIMDEEIAPFLDSYEGYPLLFNRVKVKTINGESCWVYEYVYHQPQEGVRISSGDWLNR